MGYKSLTTARNTIAGIEAMHMIFKGQIDDIPDANARDVKIFIEDLFEVRGLAA
jgi:transposase-like protein